MTHYEDAESEENFTRGFTRHLIDVTDDSCLSLLEKFHINVMNIYFAVKLIHRHLQPQTLMVKLM